LREGALGERLKRGYHLPFDEVLANIIYRESGKKALYEDHKLLFRQTILQKCIYVFVIKSIILHRIFVKNNLMPREQIFYEF
jgi:hypothetical protein